MLKSLDKQLLCELLLNNVFCLAFSSNLFYFLPGFMYPVSVYFWVFCRTMEMNVWIHFHYLKPGVLHLFHIRLQHYDYIYGAYNMFACTPTTDSRIACHVSRAMVAEKCEEPGSYLIEHPNGDLLRLNRSHLCDGTPLKAARITDKNSSIVHRGLSTRRPSASYQCLVLGCCGLIWVGLLWGPWTGSVMTTRDSRFGPTPGSWVFLLGVETGSLRPTYPAAGCIIEFQGFLWVFQCRALRADDHQLGLAPY